MKTDNTNMYIESIFIFIRSLLKCSWYGRKREVKKIERHSDMYAVQIYKFHLQRRMYYTNEIL